MSELTGPERCMINRPVSFRTARQHKTTCAGCDCEPGTTCDSQIRCGHCNASKTTCDALRSRNDDIQCCGRCDHRA